MVMKTMGSESMLPVRSRFALRGYVVVGSASLLGRGEQHIDDEDGGGGDTPKANDDESDIDVILLSSRPEESTEALSFIWRALQSLSLSTQSSAVRHHFWVVDTSVLTVLKIEGECLRTGNRSSIDLLWLGGCSFAHPFDADDQFFEFDALADYDDSSFVLPPVTTTTTSPTLNSILLSRLFRERLNCISSSFSRHLLCLLRSWAKAKHLYGTKYGYPAVFIHSL
jgi:hypothetical protein